MGINVYKTLTQSWQPGPLALVAILPHFCYFPRSTDIKNCIADAQTGDGIFVVIYSLLSHYSMDPSKSLQLLRRERPLIDSDSNTYLKVQG